MRKRIPLLGILFLFCTVTLATPPELAATLGQMFMGPLANGATATTTVLVTNRDMDPCEVEVFFHQGARIPQTPIRINGEDRGGTSHRVTVPRGGIQRFEFSSDELIAGIGSISVFGDNCDRDSVAVSASYLIEKGSTQDSVAVSGSYLAEGGSIDEAFTIPAHTPDDWVRTDRYVAISTVQDPTTESEVMQNLGIAISGVEPGVPAPDGTNLELNMFDGGGNPIGETQTFPLDGIHTALFPFPSGIRGATTGVFCVTNPDPLTDAFEYDFTTIRVNQRGGWFQYDNAIFAAGFELGDTSAWGN